MWMHALALLSIGFTLVGGQQGAPGKTIPPHQKIWHGIKKTKPEIRNCTLILNKDLGSPQPVFLVNNTYLRPNYNGDLVITSADKLVIACPGNKRAITLGNISTDSEVLEAKCLSNKTFQVEDWRGLFKDIRCNLQPYFVAEMTGETCFGGNMVFQGGYRVKNTLYPLYSGCFDRELQNTLYVKHELTPASKFGTTAKRRPSFVEGSLFGDTEMKSLYRADRQRERFEQLLGAGAHDRYLSRTQFLTRGHLAANADFSLSAQQRATFHYVNTAPQWMRGNAGDWAALEDALRRRVTSPVTVYTGTHGLLSLQDARGRLVDIYLAHDSNNRRIVPVPMYFYKLVYDPKKRLAVAFLSINSSFFNDTVVDELKFCNDICEMNSQFSWLRWRHNDGTPSFCCDYDDFAEIVDSAPKLDVVGRFA